MIRKKAYPSNVVPHGIPMDLKKPLGNPHHTSLLDTDLLVSHRFQVRQADAKAK